MEGFIKVFVTFGENQIHNVSNKKVDKLDKDCVAIIYVKDSHKSSINHKARWYFGNDYLKATPESEWNEEEILKYPKGYIELP